MPFFSNDLSLPYRRAQRDLSCRYTIGAYIDPIAGSKPQKFSLATTRPGVSLRAPEMVQLFTEASKQQARAGAAYVDPGRLRAPPRPGVRLPGGPGGREQVGDAPRRQLPGAGGLLGRRHRRQGASSVATTCGSTTTSGRSTWTPPAGGAQSRSVTLLGDTKLQAGQYDLTVVLTDPKGERDRRRGDRLHGPAGASRTC